MKTLHRRQCAALATAAFPDPTRRIFWRAGSVGDFAEVDVVNLHDALPRVTSISRIKDSCSTILMGTVTIRGGWALCQTVSLRCRGSSRPTTRAAASPICCQSSFMTAPALRYAGDNG